MRIGFPFVGRVGRRGQIEAAKPSGSTMSGLLLAQGLQDAGLDVIVLLHNNGATIDYVESLGLPHATVALPYFDKRKKITPDDIAALRAAVADQESNLRGLGLAAVHTNDAHIHRTWGFVCEWLGLRQVWHERGLFHHAAPTAQAHLRASAAIIAISDYVRSLAPPDLAPRVEVIPDPIGLTQSYDKAADRAWLRQMIGAPASARVLVMVANDNARKRWPLYFESAAMAAAERDDLHFCALGLPDPKMVAELVHKHCPPAVRSRIHDLGYRSDAVRVMSGSDVLVATARDEPLGRTPVEALLVSTPVLAAAGGGHSEILDPVAPFCIVTPDTAAEFAQRFVRVEELSAAFSQNADWIRASVADKFDSVRHAERVKTTYLGLAETGPLS